MPSRVGRDAKSLMVTDLRLAVPETASKLNYPNLSLK
jgi:hypothetical protein